MQTKKIKRCESNGPQAKSKRHFNGNSSGLVGYGRSEFKSWASPAACPRARKLLKTSISISPQVKAEYSEIVSGEPLAQAWPRGLGLPFATASCQCWACQKRGTPKGLFGAGGGGIFMKHWCRSLTPEELRWTHFESMLLGEAVSPQELALPLTNSPEHAEGSPKVPLHLQAAGLSGEWGTSPPPTLLS